jgi:hypothetical protein
VGARPDADAGFIPALRFHRLTPLFDHVAAVAVRDRAIKRRVLRPGGRLVVGDLGRPQDPLMRVAVRLTVQVLDGISTTLLNVRGGLPQVLAGAGLRTVAVRDRVRTPTGTYEIVTAAAPAA